MVFPWAFKRISVNVFLLILVFLIVPIYVSFIILKNVYENYIRQELSLQIIGNIKKGEEEFYQLFQRMANISNAFTLDRELLAVLGDPDVSYWDRNKIFDNLSASMQANNMVDLTDISITMFDLEKQTYANWGLYWNDYSLVLGEDWVRESLVNKNFVSWNFFAPSVRGKENGVSISLARSILYPPYTGRRLATIIISIGPRAIGGILARYGTDTDFIRICTRDTAESVFAMDGISVAGQEDISALLIGLEDQESGNLLCDLGGRRYLLNYYTLDIPWTFNRGGGGGESLTVMYFTDYQRITGGLRALFMAVNFRMLILLVILLAISWIISYAIGKPIRALDQKVIEYTRTRQLHGLEANRRDEIGDLTRTFIEMGVSINGLFDQLKEESEIREQYRFQALRAQTNPHFLFNTLNTIRWMAIMRNADNITDTINALARILDYSMRRSGDMAPLGDELEMIRNYVHIQNYRYGEDLEVRIDIDEELAECVIVKFILQPIVENSFIHAFRKMRGKKELSITGKKEDGCLKIFVRDNGVGMDSETLRKLRESLLYKEEKNERGRGIGLANVYQRIRAGYGPDSGFGISIKSARNGGTEIEYTLPFIKGNKNEENNDR
ncbi:MAG: sensor histidine kinase [Treponema sp.]|jgi:two-component system sensor histidine kinase YesM|nr:sensor histidine kinase [Treponema sp.]